MFPINYWCAVPESSHKCWKTIKCVLRLLRPRQWSQQVTVTVAGLTDGRYSSSPEISDSWTPITWTSPSHTRDTGTGPWCTGAHTPFSKFWLDSSYQHNNLESYVLSNDLRWRCREMLTHPINYYRSQLSPAMWHYLVTMGKCTSFTDHGPRCWLQLSPITR